MTAPNPVGYMLSAYQSHGSKIPPGELFASYTRGPVELVAAVREFSREQFLARPGPEAVAQGAGKWSSLEVLAHLADCEQFFADRMKRTVAYGAAGERPLIVGVDENKYIAAFDYQGRDPAEELDLIRLTRAQMARVLGPLAEDAWQRQAVHTEAGLMTLHQIVFHATYHVQHHLRFIELKRRLVLKV